MPISEVQERQQKMTRQMPVYTYGETATGYVCEVETWWGVFRGAGRSRKDARKAAASAALHDLSAGA